MKCVRLNGGIDLLVTDEDAERLVADIARTEKRGQTYIQGEEVSTENMIGIVDVEVAKTATQDGDIPNGFPNWRIKI